MVVGSFLPGHQLEHKHKKPRVEHHISSPPITSTHPVNLITSEELKVSFGGVKPIMTPAAFQEENINNTSFNNVNQDSRNSSADDVDDDKEDPLHEKESNLSQSNVADATC